MLFMGKSYIVAFKTKQNKTLLCKAESVNDDSVWLDEEDTHSP